MSYRKTYAEIKEMMLDAMLNVNMARDIARRAGVFPPTGIAGTNSGTGPSFVASVDPDGPTLDVLNEFGSLDVLYRNLIHDTGLGFDPGVAEPYSWIVPYEGIYRIDASVGVWRASHLYHDRIYFGLDIRDIDDAPVEFVSLERHFNYNSSTMSVDDPVVSRGTTVDYLATGWKLWFVLNQPYGDIPGADTPIEVRPDAQVSRLSVQLIRRYPEVP